MAAAKPSVRPDLEVVDVDGEAVVYDPRTRRVHYLNHSAALVLGLCDGTATAKQIAAEIADAYEMETGDVEGQIRPLLRELRVGGFLQGKDEPEDPGPEELPRDDRGRIRIVVPKST